MTLPQKEITITNTSTDFIFTKPNSPTLTFNKLTKTIKEHSPQTPPSSQDKPTTYKAHCIVGYIEAYTTDFLIAVSDITPIGNMLSNSIYKIEKFIYIPKDLSSLSSKDYTCLSMLDAFLSRNNLYYSATQDLTLSFKSYNVSLLPKQRQFNSYIFTFTATNFCWNYAISKDLDHKAMSNYVHPIINGFVGIQNAVEYNNNAYIAVIGRKDVRRSGMRFLIRGADANGNVANYVETETVLIYLDGNGKQNVLSFCQVRGSIPLIWKQEPDLQLNPKITPKNNYEENKEVFKAHIEEMIKQYEAVAIVNLIDKKKDQLKIGEYYKNLTVDYKENNRAAPVDYVWFDFHEKCKKMKYQKLAELLKVNSISKAMTTYGYTHIVLDKNVASKFNKDLLLTANEHDIVFKQVQHGVFRTNCIDCLDRTNVVQSVFARFHLHKMLFDSNIGEQPNSDPFQQFKGEFESKYKNIWADHGDRISHAYSGTNALKADFVRTGKRTMKGALVDGMLSGTRFFINNFRDGYNQDCHDYFLKALVPKKQEFKTHSLNALTVMLPCILLLTVLLYNFLIDFSLKNEDKSGKAVFKMLMFVGSFGVMFKMIVKAFKGSIIDLHTRHS